LMHLDRDAWRKGDSFLKSLGKTKQEAAAPLHLIQLLV